MVIIFAIFTANFAFARVPFSRLNKIKTKSQNFFRSCNLIFFIIFVIHES